MTRTLKDSRSIKERRRNKGTEPLKSRYLKAKEAGFSNENLWFEDLCPECNGSADYLRGVLVCEDCDWNSAGVKALNFNRSIQKKAA